MEEFFGEVRNEENILEIIEVINFKKTAEIYFLRLGGIGFRFLQEGPLRSIVRYQMESEGTIPEYVMKNQEEIVELQCQRLAFAHFITAAFFGHLAALRHASLSGAQFVGLDKILGFHRSGNILMMERTHHMDEVLVPKVQFAKKFPNRTRITKPSEFEAGLGFLNHIEKRENAFQSADLQACMTANYNAVPERGVGSG